MTVATLINTEVFDSIFRRGFKLDNYSFNAGAAQAVIGKDYPPVIICDPGGGAIDLLMPAEADAKNKLWVIINTADAVEAITVKEDSDTTTIISVGQNEAAIVYCDGTSWYALQGASV